MKTILADLRNSRRGLYWLIGIGLALEICFLTAILSFWAYKLGFFGPPRSVVISGSATPVVRDGTVLPSLPALSQTPPQKETRFPIATAIASETITQTPTISITLTASPFAPLNSVRGKIVFACFDGKFDQICLMSADGTGRRQLTHEDSPSFYPSLSPDGKQIVFSSRRDGNYEIYIMDIKGENLQKLTDNIGNLYAPEISPKGNRIVFTVSSGNTQSIWVMRIDGSNPHPLTDAKFDDIDPTWSPDGDKIGFASDRTGSTQLYVMSADGSGQRQVTHTELKIGGRSTWSPDGKRLAFYAGVQNDRNIYIVDLDGKNVEQLTNGGDNLGPSFSPDGQWIAFTTFRDGNNEIYVLHLVDLAVHRLTDNPNSDWQPRWGR